MNDLDLWEKVDTIKTLALETDYKIKLPFDWVKELGLESGVVLERTDDGILRQIHPWLHQNHQQTAEDFWSQTGDGNYLP